MGLPHKNLPFNSRQLATLEIEQLSAKELECKATLTVAFCIYPAAHRWADCWRANFFRWTYLPISPLFGHF
jgi:hypothetical protein